jgi:hypothetical protein
VTADLDNMSQFLTGRLVGNVLELSAIDEGQEMLAYVLWSVDNLCIAVWFLPLKGTSQSKLMFKSTVNCPARSFFVLAGALGLFVMLKGRGSGMATTAPARPIGCNHIGWPEESVVCSKRFPNISHEEIQNWSSPSWFLPMFTRRMKAPSQCDSV